MVVKCTQCNRQFADVERMEQHRADAHKSRGATKKKPATKVVVATTAPRRRARARASSGVSGGSRMGHLIDTGVDLLASTKITPNRPAGSPILNMSVSPDNFTGRLRQECGLWERWRPRKLDIEIVCSGSATTFGSLAVGWSADEDFVVRGGSADTGRVLSLKPSRIIRANETARMVIPCETSKKWYNVHELQDNSHGRVVALVLNTFGGFDGAFGISALFHWTIEFEGVALAIATSPLNFVLPDVEWAGPFFTTSDASFSSTVLTFKEHSGGDMITFSGAIEGTIYTNALPGQEIPYYDATSAIAKCEYFVRIPYSKFHSPGLVLFASKEKASNFIRTGDYAECIQYKAAGTWCKPTRPAFKAVSVSSESEVENLRKQLDSLNERFLSLRATEDLQDTACAVFDEPGPSTAVYDVRLNQSVRKALKLAKVVDSDVKEVKADLISRPKGTAVSPVVAVPLPIPERSGAAGSSASSYEDVNPQYPPGSWGAVLSSQRKS